MVHPSSQKNTLTVITYDDKILLGMKKRGFGAGMYNGFGGKPEEGESLLQCVCRETFEEANIELNKNDIELIAILDFYFMEKPEWNQQVHVFKAESFMGDFSETEEMLPREFSLDEIPYDNMWSDDIYWLPLVLDGKKVYGEVHFDGDGNVHHHTIGPVEELEE